MVPSYSLGLRYKDASILLRIMTSSSCHRLCLLKTVSQDKKQTNLSLNCFGQVICHSKKLHV
ncbi:rCG36912 [Rattus norvegicus]|uniref:RCG36912 n=1 Tax=Rattus norvegicus TaxID=10116 RepID=A6HUA6_RAT|nr:rCG36912 [Rattus norvegicus]